MYQTSLTKLPSEKLNSPEYLAWRKLQLSRAKLKTSRKTSAILSGFAMIALVEAQINDDTNIPVAILILFAICTTLLVSVHILALMISTCILPKIEAISNMQQIELVNESPHEKLHWYTEAAWVFSTVLGLILFLLEITILCWVMFYDVNQEAAWSGCIIIIPVIIVFIGFAVHFYRLLVLQKLEVTCMGIKELELINNDLMTCGGVHSFNSSNSQFRVNSNLTLSV